MYKFLAIWCLVSITLFCFTGASPTRYEYKGNLIEKKFSSALQTRNYGVQPINDVTKRDFPDKRALNLAFFEGNKADATVNSVLKALFELLVGKGHPVAARAAEILSIDRISYKTVESLLSFNQYIFQHPFGNEATLQFVSELTRVSGYSGFAVGVTLGLTSRMDPLLLNDRFGLQTLLQITSTNTKSLNIGNQILITGEQFLYKGPFTISMVAEVVVAAVAAGNGEVRSAPEIALIMSHLSQ
jgi:hypothetical protein